MIMNNGFSKRGKIRIVDFEDKYLEAAAEIFIQNFKLIQNEYSLLPKRYGSKKIVLELLKKTLKRNYGVIALLDDKVIGYLSGAIISKFKSSFKGVYTPEWAHGSVPDGRNDIYSAMYNMISTKWFKDKCIVHAITAMGYESELINHLFWTGYGMHVVDAVSEIKEKYYFKSSEIDIRIADKNDIYQLEELLKEHIEYMTSGPIFLYAGKISIEEEIENWFNDQQRVLWVAESKGEILGYMNTVSHATNACTIVRSEKTLSIQGTHVREKSRRLRVGETLLKKAHEYALENGYEMLSVDFESANNQATRFWLKHFKPVCYSLIRYIDDRSRQRDRFI